MKFSQKRVAMALAAVGLISIGSAMGATTSAKYATSFQSGINNVRAAKFNVTTDGLSNVAKDLVIKPGEYYVVNGFKVNKNDTEVNVQGRLVVEAKGNMFDENSPVALHAYMVTSDNKTKQNLTLTRDENGNFVSNTFDLFDVEGVEDIRLEVNWPKRGATENDALDTQFKDSKGTVKINFEAFQVK